MYYKLKYHTIFRRYNDIGYLIYQRLPFDIDRVVNTTGAIFVSYLSYEPRDLSCIAEDVVKNFIGVSPEEIKSDLINFYNDLVAAGFLESGDSYTECNNKTDFFDYNVSQQSKLEELVMKQGSGKISSQEYLAKYFADKPQLLKFQIEITNRCNERCIHCYIPHKDKCFDMSDEMYYNIINELKSIGIVSLGISGGEPMVHPHFKEFIEAAKKLDVSINILTNLTLLTDEYIELFRHSRIIIVPSLYSLNEEHHDYITQVKGSCKKTIDAILKLRENNIPVQINCPLMKTNKDDFMELMHWAKKLNISVKTDNCIIARSDRTTDNLSNRIDLQEMQEITDEIIAENTLFTKLISRDNYEEQCEILLNDELGKWCGVGISCCATDVHGDVYPCPSWADYACGNLNEQSLSEIWNNAPKFKYLRTLTKKDFAKCEGCADKAYCSVCMARNANESPTKDPLDVSDYFCQLAHMNKLGVEKWRKEHLNK